VIGVRASWQTISNCFFVTGWTDSRMPIGRTTTIAFRLRLARSSSRDTRRGNFSSNSTSTMNQRGASGLLFGS